MTTQTNQPRKKIAILISGNGSNLQTFIDEYQESEVEIALVLCNRPNAFGLERARKANIPTALVDHTLYAERHDFDQAMIKVLDEYNLDALVLAGFMRILTSDFVQHFKGRLFNIHPSLLPKYPGLHTHRRAIEAGDSHGGVTVHFVTEELDGGPAILQARVAIKQDETEQTLAERVLEKEHIIYPRAISWFLNGQLQLKGNYAYFKEQQLPSSGKKLEEL